MLLYSENVLRKARLYRAAAFWQHAGLAKAFNAWKLYVSERMVSYDLMIKEDLTGYKGEIHWLELGGLFHG